MKEILFINGPNLGRLGTRKPEIYGSETLEKIISENKKLCDDKGLHLISYNSNHEGNIIDFIEDHHSAWGLVINPGALMMSGWALRDCLEDFPGLKIEIHISNIWEREQFRHESVLSSVVQGVVAGMGTAGYKLAINYLAEKL